jgi:chromate reductase, NAD(P)H dehydrogenase (quinone)
MTQTARPPLRILVFGASLRVGSLNDRLATLASKTIEDHGATVDRAHMRDFETPSYDGDVQAADGFPAGAAALRERLLAADGFVLASPEYNFSFPGVLKNSIDWVSRYRPQPFKGKHGLLMSASASMAGGNRGLWALRVPLEHLGATLHPDMFSLAQAHQAFDDAGRIADPALQEWFEGTIAAYLDQVEAVVHYPCAKTAWVEFLGEHDDPATHRVETS